MTKIFDNAFRTIVERTPELIVLLINEFFGTDYNPYEAVIQTRNEHFNSKGEVITDSVFIIRGNMYHIEVQSTEDGTMAIRMIEYDFMIALEFAEKVDGIYRIKFPHSCVLYIRRESQAKETEDVEVEFQDGQMVLFKVPTIPGLSYNLESIFDRRLYALFPYYILRYEKQEHIVDSDQAHDKLLNDYNYIVERLTQLIESGERCGYISVILELIQTIIEEVLKEQPETKEEVKKLMGGEVLKLASDKLREESYNKGCEEGINLITNAISDLKAGVPYEDICSKYGKKIADTAMVFK